MKNHTFLIHIVSVVFTLTSCASPSSNIATSTLIPPNEFTKTYEPLREEKVSSLVEMTSLSSPSFSSPLLKVGYLSEDNIVVGVYKNEGTVVGWKADTADIAFNHELGIVSSKALLLIASGENLVGPMDHVFKLNSLNQNIEYLNGIALWDVRTGILIQCIAYPCQKNSGLQHGFLGLAIDLNGERLAFFDESGVGLSSLSGNAPVLDYTINAEDASYSWRIGSVAFDSHNHRLAVIFQEGRVYVSNIENPLNYQIIAKGEKGDIVPITDAQIDPTGRWLLVARGNKTRILNLENGKVLLQIEVSNPVLSFDRTGELLFVGAGNKLAIYSIVKSLKIFEYDAPGITSLAISEDNRLLIWGDQQGKIHVWGKPSSQP